MARIEGIDVATSLQERLCSLNQAFHRDPVMTENVGLTAGHGVLVGNADDLERDARAGLQQNARACFSKSAENTVLFDRDDCAALPGRLENRIGIERLDRVRADDAAGK